MKKTLKHRLASWVLHKAKSIIKEEHLKVHRNDIRCPNCKEWFSISGEEHKHYVETNGCLYLCTCGKCNHTSHWNPNIAPALILCDEKGMPISK